MKRASEIMSKCHQLSVLKTDMKNMKFDSSYPCATCEKSFKKFIIFEGHFAFNAKCRRNSGSFMQCYICGNKFRHLAVLKYHLRRHVKNKTTSLRPKIVRVANGKSSPRIGFNCNICRKRFRTKAYLSEHKTKHSKVENKYPSNADTQVDIVNSKTSPSFECNICKMDCLEKTALARHMNDHKFGEVECNFCSIRFTKKSLTIHAREVHPGADFGDVCREIDSSTISSQREQLQRPKECRETLPTENHRVQHEKVHTGEIECKICRVKVSQLSMELHQRQIHANVSVDKLSETAKNDQIGEKRTLAETNGYMNGDESKKELIKHDTEERVYTRNAKRRKTLSGDFDSKEHHGESKTLEFSADKQIYNERIQRKETISPTNGIEGREVLNQSVKSPIQEDFRGFSAISKRRQTAVEKHISECEVSEQLREAKVKERRKTITSKLFREINLEKHLREMQANKKLNESSTSRQLRDRTIQIHNIVGKPLFPGNASTIKQRRNSTIEKPFSECKTKNQLHEGTTIRQRRKTVTANFFRGSHSESKKEDAIIKCKLCQAKFSFPQNLARHMSSHMGDLECKICAIPFTRYSLLIHMKEMHSELKEENVCQVANKKKEERNTRNGERKIPIDSEYQCQICKQTFFSKQRRIRHEGVHKGDLECKICRVKFTKFSLALHVNRFHPGAYDKELESEEKESETEKQLDETTSDEQIDNSEVKNQQHETNTDKPISERTASNKNIFRCKFCKHKSRNRSEKGNNKFAFRLTGRRNTTDDTISDRHEMVHRGNFECKICRIPFTKTSLERHEQRYHTNKRSNVILNQLRYKCPICKKSFHWPKTLARHRSVHQGSFRCEICRIPFKKSALKSHNRRYHQTSRRNSTDSDDTEDISSNELEQKDDLPNENENMAKKSPENVSVSEKRAAQSETTPRTNGNENENMARKSRENVSVAERRARQSETTQRTNGNENENMVRKSRENVSVAERRSRHSETTPRTNGIMPSEQVNNSGEFDCEICSTKYSKFTRKQHEANCNGKKKAEQKIAEESDKLVKERGKAQQPHAESESPRETRSSSSRRSSEASQNTNMSVTCDLCTKTCRSPHHYVMHYKVHTAGDVQCNVCFVKLTARALKSHKDFCLGKDTPQPNVPEESRGSSNDDGSEKTLSDQSDRSEPMESVENQSLQEDELLEEWQIVDEREFLERGENRSLRCDICGKNCRNSFILKKHKKSHTSGELKCNKCSMKISRNIFKSHREMCQGTKELLNGILLKSEPENTEEISMETSYNCDQCNESFVQPSSLEIHKKCHRKYSCNVCAKRFGEKKSLQCHKKLHIFECYVCKKAYPSTKKLQLHVEKHVVYEQWVDPINVFLSNWSPEASREILLNQPLVLVENLNINTIDLHFKPNKDTLIKDEVEIVEIIECNGENDNYIEYGGNGEHVGNVEHIGNGENVGNGENGTELPTINDLPNLSECNSKPIQIEQKLISSELLSDIDEIPIVMEQLPDTTTIYVDDNIESERDVVDLSSESDVSDILELFHCYFCDETFRSLEGLGVHVKTCSFCP
ncbi:Zinc finger protein [Pseudolycoriella hygida]|uniref:Zinc finger protein n=1 Tax=Pseudolycoriella hygida TaxID=35572 RepID=A0A9Q0N520_9DIPT|nr:Zinc finger protein [Pseudolycoriella hygida]